MSENAVAQGPRRRRRRPLVIRPARALVEAVVVRLEQEGAVSPAGGVPRKILVATLCQETGCSQATAYRAVADGFEAGWLAAASAEGAR